VDTNERAMQFRVLVSARDAGRNWDLRCRVREELVYFIQRNYPEYLPRIRADLTTKSDNDKDEQDRQQTISRSS
jgi:hypothetical protein